MIEIKEKIEKEDFMLLIILIIIISIMVLTMGDAPLEILGFIFWLISFICDKLKIKFKYDPSKRENWKTLIVRIHPETGDRNWTFKRNVGQNFFWAVFGNDHAGVIPFFKEEIWSFWRWWFRNRCVNWQWHIMGYAHWEEGNPASVWNVDHLETKDIIDRQWFQMHIVKPKAKNFWYWRPFFSFTPGKLDVHWGWRKRGQPAVGILWDKEG